MPSGQNEYIAMVQQNIEQYLENGKFLQDEKKDSQVRTAITSEAN